MADNSDRNTADEDKARRKQEKADERCLTKKVNISRVNMPVIKRWMTETLHVELPDDDVAVEFIYELLVGAEDYEPEVGAIREQMDDFLGKTKSRDFCVRLWQLLLDAQDSRDGVPQSLVDERKAKIEREARDAKAMRETELILGSLRSNASINRSRTERRGQETRPKPRFDSDSNRRVDSKVDSQRSQPKMSFSEPEKPMVKPETAGLRVGKPPRKTNYNRS